MPVREAFAGEVNPCVDCALRTPPYFCGTLFESDASGASARSHQFAARRRIISRGNEASDSIAIICEGWACTYVSLPSGKRQILNFLLPGDMTSPAAVFLDHSGFSIEAVTDIRYRMIDKAEFRSAMACDPKLFDAFSRRWAEREEEVGQLVTDLGHKTAEQRIARLLHGLMQRHRARNLVHDGGFEFPLRQQHIAEATGLTVVHVNRVLGNMRRLGIVEIKGRSLTVLDEFKFAHLAS